MSKKIYATYRNNFEASGIPIGSDDERHGYGVGSLWLYDGYLYRCTDATASNAVWARVESKELFETITAGENLVYGDLVYLKSDGKYWKSDYTTSATCATELRIAYDTISANATGRAYICGEVASSGLTVGSRYYVGSSGAFCLEANIPDTEGIIIRYVGTAKSSTSLLFFPDSNYYETTLISGGSGVGYGRSVNTGQSGSVSAGSTALTDYVYIFTGAGTLTLPTAVGNTNSYTVKNRHTSNITVSFTGGQNADGSTSITIVPNQSLDFISNGSNYVII
jgi:hypothetical protein